MSQHKAELTNSSSEVAERVEAARRRAGERVILVPVDFSDHSRAALLHACELADLIGAAIVVLHVVHDPGEMPGYYTTLIKKKRFGRIQDTAAEAFDDFMAGAIDTGPGLHSLQQAERLMVIGLPVSRVLEVADVAAPYLVVVGSQGRTGLKNLVIGSKASQIVQLCPVPVTVVKCKKHRGKE